MGNRLKAIETLVVNPVFQLSTAGQELFHTNMLYWLALHRPHESQPLWNALGLPSAAPADHTSLVKREWRHIDLLVDPGAGQQKLVLENKVGAIPTEEQLAGYWSALHRDRRFDDVATTFVLLTLVKPAMALPKPWQLVAYSDLLPALDETVKQLAGQERELVASYARLVRDLVNIAEALDPLSDLDEPMLLSDEELALLREGRLLPLVLKMRVSRAAEQIRASLSHALSVPVGEVEANLTNAQGLNSWFIRGPAGRHFGWQAQGQQFRLAVITARRDPKRRDEREAVVKREHHNYFDFTLPTGPLEGLLQPYTGAKEWLGYEPNFVYRYQTLDPSITWRQFVALVTHFSKTAETYVSRESKEGVAEG